MLLATAGSFVRIWTILTILGGLLFSLVMKDTPSITFQVSKK